MGRHSQTEAVCAIGVVRRIITALRRLAALRTIAPAPTPVPSGIACWGACRVYGSLCCVWATPILHPFPDIAVHVEQAPGIRLELPHRMCGALVVFVIPRILLQEGIIIPKRI